MTLDKGFLTGFSFEGGTTGDTFLWFVEEILLPKLWSGAVVVMDNLPAHKVQGMTEAIASVGAKVVYLVLIMCHMLRDSKKRIINTFKSK